MEKEITKVEKLEKTRAENEVMQEWADKKKCELLLFLEWEIEDTRVRTNEEEYRWRLSRNSGEKLSQKPLQEESPKSPEYYCRPRNGAEQDCWRSGGEGGV